MKKLFLLLFVGILCATGLDAQIILSADQFRTPESDVKIRLLDSLTNNPLVMATVYLQPKGDTTIMYFNLTDTSGTAVLEKVVRGNYNLTAEFLGYKPFKKSFYFRDPKVDIGTVKMVEDMVMLEAAKVTAVGNAIEVKQDTIVYNASMFRTADNAVLGELLKKMPGFEVSSNGEVTQNGVKVSKITVNGRTFFFDDPTMAVKNLPAKIVDKIKITDYKSDTEKSTGISDMASTHAKEMDISLKKEYEQGWFGNAKLAAGAPIAPESSKAGMLVGGKDFMYNGNVMLSGYNEKDQVTFIGNMLNTPNMGTGDYIVVMYGGDEQGGKSRPAGGLTSSRQLGANLNTTRIKGFNSTATANYKGNLIESEKVSQRNTFQGDASSILSNSEYTDNYRDDLLDVGLELKNTNQKKVYARIAPKFNYTKVKRDSRTTNQTSQDGDMMNESDTRSYLESDYFMHKTEFYLTLKNLGKEQRSITVNANYSISNDDSQSKEYSNILYYNSGENAIKDLYYKSRTESFSYKANVKYVEPLGKQWNISVALGSNLRVNDVTSDAFTRPYGEETFTSWFGDKGDYKIYDDYYSSVSNYRYFRNSGELLSQYSKDKITLQFGATAEAVNNENYSKSYGISQTTGKGEYLWNWAPFLRFRNGFKNGANLNINYSGSSSALGNSQITPVPNISNPVYITIGNIYLETPFTNDLWMLYSYNNKKNFSYWQVYVNGTNTNNGIVYANWFDNEGVQYNVPVNSRKGRNNVSLSASGGSIPLNKERSLTFGLNANVSYSLSYSYQNVAQGASIDLDTFNYSDFMNEFWGNSQGSKFYSGQSGFEESKTVSTSVTTGGSIKYKTESFTGRIGGSATYTETNYSINKNANVEAWNFYTYCTMQYDTKNKFSFISDLGYRFYRGYTNWFGQPALSWNIEAYKTVKAFTFGLKVNDILNQTSSFSRNTTANYVEDTYKNIIGRHFLVSLTFNFGKMNTAKNRSATSAMFNMM